MDERTRLLISLGAATAANCVPCFHTLFTKANAVGLTSEEIKEAADIGDQVKKGAQIAIRIRINDLLGRTTEDAAPCNTGSERPCCA